MLYNYAKRLAKQQKNTVTLRKVRIVLSLLLVTVPEVYVCVYVQVLQTILRSLGSSKSKLWSPYLRYSKSYRIARLVLSLPLPCSVSLQEG